MRQFDVFVNPVAHARRAFPFVAVLQADLAEAGGDRVVAPLASLTLPSGRLAPTVALPAGEYALLVPRLTTMPTGGLGRPVANVASHRDAIVAALDYLFLGV